MRTNMRISTRLLILCALTIGVAAPARICAARTSLDVEIGWDGGYRFGRWGPIYITASDPTPRNVLVELYVPHDQIHAMRIRQGLTIGATATTFAMYAPLGGGMEDMSVTVLDASTHRRLATWLAQDDNGMSALGSTQAGAQLVGISGSDVKSPMLQGQLSTETCLARSIDPLRLPAVPIGYDSLNLLVLSRPDLAKISNEQQQAIVDWIRAGGSMVCWMGEDALPASSPILNILPAIIGDNISIQVKPQTIRSLALPPRFENLKARALTPLPDAQRLPLLDGATEAFKHRVGFGNVLLLPIDPSTFLFQQTAKAHEFWRPLVSDAVQLIEPQNNPQGNANYYYNTWNEPSYQRRATAMTQAMDRIGDVPGAGKFGFWYIAVAMGGLMFVVGPLDWIVLKRLGRQPWTWITTSGWIVLVTLGAVYAGQTFKSGDLHFRTIRLIDQADGMTVATTDAAAIYSPRSTDYLLKADPESWWEPMAANAYWSRGGMKIDVDFHQDYRGTTPGPMRVNVWNVRFMMDQQIAPVAKIIDASLRLEKHEGQNRLIGSITNRGQSTLLRLALQCSAGVARDTAARIPPGSTCTIDLPLERPQPLFHYEQFGPPEAPNSAGVWDLAIDRTLRLEQIMKDRQDVVCIYASSDDPAAPVELSPAPTKQQHWQMIRAIVPLEVKQ